MVELLVCSNRKQLKQLKNICGSEYIIGTSKYAFYVECKKTNETIVYLEPDELSDYSTIISIIKRITNIIESCNLQKQYLYRISYHLEGGLPSTIDRMLQNIKVIKKVFQEYRIDKIYLVDDKENWMINEAFFIYAHNKRIDCHILDELAEKEQACLFTLRRSNYNPNPERLGFDTQEQLEQWKYWMNQENKHPRSLEMKSFEMGFLYAASNNGKHLKWALDDIQLYQNEFNVGIISFYNNEDNEYFRQKGISVECLEDYFDKELFEKNYKIYLEDCQYITNRIDENLYFILDDIDLSEYLNRKFLNYLERTCFHKLYIDTCSHTFFKIRKYCLIEAWGNTNFWQSNILYANSRHWNTKFFRRDIVEVFDAKEYEPYANEICIRIWCNKKMNAIWDLGNYTGKIYSVPDYNWRHYIRNVRESIKLSLENKIKILLAPTCPLIGFSTVKNYLNICTSVLETLPSEQVTIFFKNHPNIEKELEDEIEQKYSTKKNILFVNKMQGIWEVIQICDFVITDVSTVIFDTIKAGKPVFCIAGCQDYEFIRHHEGNFKIYRDIDKLCKDVIAFSKDRYRLEKQLQSMLCNQDTFIKNLVGKTMEDGYKALHDVIREEMDNKLIYI